LLILKVCSIRWNGGLEAGKTFEGRFIVVFIWFYAPYLSAGPVILKDGRGAEKDERRASKNETRLQG
jgi:hypothetical protein